MAKLRAVKPTAVEKRLKMFLFGQAGVGKTMASIQFPRVYMIDTEKGAENDQYVKALEKAGGVYLFTNDLEEIISEVMALMTEKHEYRTLVIDPATVPYNAACDKAALEIQKRANDPKIDGTEWGRHRGIADRLMKRLCALLMRLDMNVILTSHSKVKWGKVGTDFKEMGNTFDAYSKLDYLFDLLIEVEKRGADRVGMVRKTRIEAFPEGDVFPFTYDTIADRYGRQILEREAEAVALASADQVAKLHHMTRILKVEDAEIDKWLEKANAESFAELSAVTAAQLIEWLEKKMAVPTTATTERLSVSEQEMRDGLADIVEGVQR